MGVGRHRIEPIRTAGLVLALMVEAAACGGSSNSPTSTSGGNAAGVTYAKAQVDKYRGIPQWVAPGPAFNAKAAAGKTLFVIPVTNTVPFVQTIADGMGAISKQIGVNYVEWPNQGQPSQWVQGMNTAIDRNASSIDLLAGLNPQVVGPQIQAAKAKNTSVVVAHLYDVKQAMDPNITAAVNIPYEQAGRLLADWVIWKTNGNADALAIRVDEVLSTVPMMAGMQDEFTKHCQGCKLDSFNVGIVDVASKIQPGVQSALVRDPKINYVIALYDSAEGPFAVAGIKAAGKQDSVKVVTFNGTASVLKTVAAKDVVEMDIGENLDWIAYAIMDQHLRLMTGQQAITDPHVPLRIFDSTNISEVGSPPQDSTGYGSAYQTEYRKLWQLSS
jgi:ribose transport system substrate-binding protein